MRVLFLHGLESTVDEQLRPVGRKVQFLRTRVDLVAPALDTRRAIAVAQRCVAATGTWAWPFDDYDEAFAVPMARAREALTGDIDVLLGSSFGGAVALRLLHEAPRWTGPTLLLVGAGPKLTPYTTLPPGVPVHLIHGRHDDVVPPQDSIDLAATSRAARLTLVDDDHRLAQVTDDAHLGRWIREAVAGAPGR